MTGSPGRNDTGTKLAEFFFGPPNHAREEGLPPIREAIGVLQVERIDYGANA